MTIVKDDARVVNKLEASLTDNARVIIYGCHMLIVQATGGSNWQLIYPYSPVACSNYADLNPELVTFHIMDEVHDKSHVTQEKPWFQCYQTFSPFSVPSL
jgi:hypothetical protein